MREGMMNRRTKLILLLLSVSMALEAGGSLQLTCDEDLQDVEYEISLSSASGSVRIGGGRVLLECQLNEEVVIKLGHGGTSGVLTLFSDQNRYTGSAGRKQPRKLVKSSLPLSFGTPDTLLVDCGELKGAVRQDGSLELLVTREFSECWYSELYLYARGRQQRGLYRQVHSSSWMRSEVSLGIQAHGKRPNEYRYAAELVLFSSSCSLLFGTTRAFSRIPQVPRTVRYYLRTEATGGAFSVRHSIILSLEEELKEPLFDDCLLLSCSSSESRLEVKLEDLAAYGLYQIEEWKLSALLRHRAFTLKATCALGDGPGRKQGSISYSRKSWKLSLGYDGGLTGRLDVKVQSGSVRVEHVDSALTVRFIWELSPQVE